MTGEVALDLLFQCRYCPETFPDKIPTLRHEWTKHINVKNVPIVPLIDLTGEIPIILNSVIISTESEILNSPNKKTIQPNRLPSSKHEKSETEEHDWPKTKTNQMDISNPSESETNQKDISNPPEIDVEIIEIDIATNDVKKKPSFPFHQCSNTCNRCGQKLGTKLSLAVHLLSHDAQEKPYRCQKCNKSFNHAWSIEDHKKKFH